MPVFWVKTGGETLPHERNLQYWDKITERQEGYPLSSQSCGEHMCACVCLCSCVYLICIFSSSVFLVGKRTTQGRQRQLREEEKGKSYHVWNVALCKCFNFSFDSHFCVCVVGATTGSMLGGALLRVFEGLNPDLLCTRQLLISQLSSVNGSC